MRSKKFLVVGAIVLFSCENDNTSDLIDSTSIPENVSYTLHVKPIIDNNCISCHGTVQTGGAPMALTTYANVKDAVLNRNLIDRISRQTGEPGAMPSGGIKMPQHNIDIIVEWKNDEFLE